jgi:hypothetical protein
VASSCRPIKRTARHHRRAAIDRTLAAHDENVTTPLSACSDRVRDGAKKIARIVFRAKSKNLRGVAGARHARVKVTCGQLMVNKSGTLTPGCVAHTVLVANQLIFGGRFSSTVIDLFQWRRAWGI